MRNHCITWLATVILTTGMSLSISGCRTTTDNATPSRLKAPPTLLPEGYDPGTIRHVVLCWLKDSGNAVHRERILHASRRLEAIPGVRSVKGGIALPSQREIVDASFDLGLVIIIEDADALVSYLGHPIHVQLVNEAMAPYVEKILVYDIME